MLLKGKAGCLPILWDHRQPGVCALLPLDDPTSRFSCSNTPAMRIPRYRISRSVTVTPDEAPRRVHEPLPLVDLGRDNVVKGKVGGANDLEKDEELVSRSANCFKASRMLVYIKYLLRVNDRYVVPCDRLLHAAFCSRVMHATVVALRKRTL